jgi:hypothetical protein
MSGQSYGHEPARDPITGKRKAKPRPLPWPPERLHEQTVKRIDRHLVDSDNRYESRCKCGWKSELTSQESVFEQFNEHVAMVGGIYSPRTERGTG